MIEIRNLHTLNGRVTHLEIPSKKDLKIDASGLTLFPGLIDPHVHFRTPGLEHKEDWITGAQAAIKGGITTVFDMPNTLPPCITKERVDQKKELIDKQLHKADIPLRYGLYLGADKSHFDEIARCKGDVIGLKVFMGASTGDLVMDDDSSLHAAFSLAAAHDLILAVHAEDEAMIRMNKEKYKNPSSVKLHSQIRSREAAMRATEKAIALCKLYRTRLYLLHIGTKEEVELIRRAKREGAPLAAETTPHQLFLNETAYDKWGTKAQMNPPLRTKEDNEALWHAIKEGVIDTIGSDHAPHTEEEKAKPYGQAPSGIPGVETTFPLLLNAVHQGLLANSDIVRLMQSRIEEFFRIEPNDDSVLVDLNLKKKLEAGDLKTKCGWSPYVGQTLQGWPRYTILKGSVYRLD